MNTDPSKTRGIWEEIDLLNLPDWIRPTQKALPPYMPVEKPYFGFKGVLLLDTIKDRIQCHICGFWFKAVGQHLKEHGVNSKEYKDMFNLYRKEPLSSLGTIRLFRRNGKIRRKEGKLRNSTKEERELGLKSTEKTSPNGVNKIQFYNKFGTCEAQLKMRIDKWIETNGHFPTQSEDKALTSCLYRRFGSVEKAKEYYKYE